MVPEEKLILQVRKILWERGQEALELAKKTILEEKIPFEPLQEAVRYFITSWEDVLHPALLALACEAVGGKSDVTTKVGAAFVILAGGADVHDDAIDQSIVKDSKPTVFGKYGKDFSVLVGDALLFKGLYMLHEACEVFPISPKQQVLELTEQAFLGISSAEAREASLRGRIDSEVAEEYLKMIKTKAAVAQAAVKIGAVLGGGTTSEIESLGNYGQTLGMLYTMRDDFIDIFELDELSNRAKNEVLPLPVLLALKDNKKANKIKSLLKGDQVKEKENEIMLELVIGSKEAAEMKKLMTVMIKEANQQLFWVKANKETLELLLRSMVEDL